MTPQINPVRNSSTDSDTPSKSENIANLAEGRDIRIISNGIKISPKVLGVISGLFVLGMMLVAVSVLSSSPQRAAAVQCGQGACTSTVCGQTLNGCLNQFGGCSPYDPYPANYPACLNPGTGTGTGGSGTGTGGIGTGTGGAGTGTGGTGTGANNTKGTGVATSANCIAGSVGINGTGTCNAYINGVPTQIYYCTGTETVGACRPTNVDVSSAAALAAQAEAAGRAKGYNISCNATSLGGFGLDPNTGLRYYINTICTVNGLSGVSAELLMNPNGYGWNVLQGDLGSGRSTPSVVIDHTTGLPVSSGTGTGYGAGSGTLGAGVFSATQSNLAHLQSLIRDINNFTGRVAGTGTGGSGTGTGGTGTGGTGTGTGGTGTGTGTVCASHGYPAFFLPGSVVAYMFSLGTTTANPPAGSAAALVGYVFNSQSQRYELSTAAASNTVSVSLTANGSNRITVSPGQSISYTWSATGAVSASSSYVADGGDTCPGGVSRAGEVKPWAANNLAGTLSAAVQACQAGRTYTITYQAQNASGQVASKNLTITVLRSP